MGDIGGAMQSAMFQTLQIQLFSFFHHQLLLFLSIVCDTIKSEKKLVIKKQEKTYNAVCFDSLLPPVV